MMARLEPLNEKEPADRQRATPWLASTDDIWTFRCAAHPGHEVKATVPGGARSSAVAGRYEPRPRPARSGATSRPTSVSQVPPHFCTSSSVSCSGGISRVSLATVS